MGSGGATPVVSLGSRASAEPSPKSPLQFFDGCLSLTRLLSDFQGRTLEMECCVKTKYFFCGARKTPPPEPSAQTSPQPPHELVLKGRISSFPQHL